jgi:long-chain acyl-CoA synthetase
MESLPPLNAGENYDRKILEAVHAKVKLIFGGRLRLLISASAPISNEVMNFYKEALGIHVYECYGQTEISGPGTFTHPLDKHSTGHVGGLIPTLRVRLRDCPELGYLSTDNPPRGEVQFKGTNVFKGYFKNPTRT